MQLLAGMWMWPQITMRVNYDCGISALIRVKKQLQAWNACRGCNSMRGIVARKVCTCLYVHVCAGS